MNTPLTISMITNEALMVLENALVFTKRVNRSYDDRFGVEGAKIGTVLNVRKPPRYVGRSGQALQIEDAVETSVAVTLNTQFGVDIQFTSQDLLLNVDNFSDRFLKPAMATIANKIDYDGLQLYKEIANYVGVPATTPAALSTYLDAGVLLNNEAAPRDDQRALVLSPKMEGTIISNMLTYFNPVRQIGDQYKTGTMGVAAGFEWAMDQNTATHTVGQLGGTPLVNGASQIGASLVTDGWTAAAANRLKRGDVIEIADVDAVNPQSRQSTGSLRKFLVTQDVASDGSGNATIPIWPSITVTGSGQTVDASPANNAVITIFNHASSYASKVSPQGLAFHRDFATLVTADLPLPGGVDMAARASDNQLGISIRLVRAYDIQTDKFPCRLDVLYGWTVLRPELACRICA